MQKQIYKKKYVSYIITKFKVKLMSLLPFKHKSKSLLSSSFIPIWLLLLILSCLIQNLTLFFPKITKKRKTSKKNNKRV